MPSGGHRMNAGRPGRLVKVEDCRRLDVRELSRAGLLNVSWRGRWQWRDPETRALTAEISIRTTSTRVMLRFRHKEVQIYEAVELTRTPCKFGGHRTWFTCPGCKSRRAVLHLKHSHFRCRRCHDLRYQSQSADAIGRTWTAQSKLERMLGTGWRRPKGMHVKTREKIVSAIIDFETLRESLMRDFLHRALVRESRTQRVQSLE